MGWESEFGKLAKVLEARVSTWNDEGNGGE